ncbi:MAG: hypothetical protein U9R51_08060 [Actinomycetota bacterium]|nr:hypothetical protein [Actinomycetota bacterium]
MVDRIRRFVAGAPESEPPEIHRSFSSWDDVDPTVVQVCHPDWHGVRAATRAFRTPIIESSDFTPFADSLADELASHGVSTLVVQAWPPGSTVLIEAVAARDIGTRIVSHSSMAQHGTDAGEGEAVTEAFGLATRGLVQKVGFVKEGLADAFRAMGHPAVYVPNRSPELPEYETTDLGDGVHVGILLDPYWRKNVTTQLGAAAILGATAHVNRIPEVGYLDDLRIVEHGSVPWDAFIGLQASMDLNLNVTLSECHPMSPMESYLSGVPSLVSATSALFRDDPDLYEMTTVTEADNPRAIAAKAARLMENRSEAVERAVVWLNQHDVEARERFADFAD